MDTSPVFDAHPVLYAMDVKHSFHLYKQKHHTEEGECWAHNFRIAHTADYTPRRWPCDQDDFP